MKTFSLTARFWRRFLTFWHRRPLRSQGGILVVLPLFAALISFFIAYYGNRDREIIETDIERQFQIVTEVNNLEKQMVDAETGMRGFVLTERAEFLEPYQYALNSLPQTIERLRRLIENEAGETRRAEIQADLAAIETLLKNHITALEELKTLRQNNVALRNLYDELQGERNRMEALRRALEKLAIQEKGFLNDRLDEIKYIRWRDYIVLFVTLSLAFIVRLFTFYLFDRGIVRRVNRLKECVVNWRKGEEAIFADDHKEDALGQLEKEISEAFEHFKKRSDVG